MFGSFSKASSLATLLATGGVWLVLTCVDWIMRFTWFRWHERVVGGHMALERGSFPPLHVFTNPPVRGGDLTTLMGNHPRVDSYKEWKPAATNWSDEFGFRNRPPTAAKDYAVVVVGDSFMLAGPRMEETFAGVLESRTGLRIYNYAIDGRGPLWPMAQFLASPRFAKNTPPVIIWGLLERDLPGLAFSEDVAAQIGIKPRRSVYAMHLKPEALKRELPNTALSAQMTARIWTCVADSLLTAPEIPVLEAADGSMLFYKPAVCSLTQSVDPATISNIATTIACVAELCRKRGSQLMVVLIPDKERVYAERLPESVLRSPLAPSGLDALEALLRLRGIKVVNLLSVFRMHASQGEQLYWRDDTHWNSRGVELAVQTLMTSWTPVFSAAINKPRKHAVQ